MSGKLPDLSGQRIGEYEVIARVGMGGMGAVYEGRQPMIGKRVAVKVLLPQFSEDQELVERFMAEARAVNAIRHRGIVDIFSMGQLPDGSHYFVMEFLEGLPFDKVIKQRAPLSLAEVLQWSEETLDALDAAHEAGIIHRDIKPSNLFLVDHGRGKPYLKLLDFGIAKLGATHGEATPQTRASVIIGTPDYLAPEQARGKPISAQTDLYAFGCVMFEMLTGRRPFKGENELATMWMHVEDQAPPPSSLNADCPPEIDELVLWAMEKDANNRPRSAAEMREHVVALRATLLASMPMTPASGRVPSLGTPPPISRGGLARPPTPAPSSRGGMARPPTPAPTSRGGSRSRPGTPSPGEALSTGAETRVAPMTAIEQAPVGVSDNPFVEEATQLRDSRAGRDPSLQSGRRPPVADTRVLAKTPPGEPNTDADVEVAPPARSKAPLIIAGLLGLAVVGAAALLALPSGPPAPIPVVQVPESERPEVAKQEVVTPEVAKPEVVTPEVVTPEVAKPEVAKPEVAKPEVVKPEVVKPEVDKPTVKKPRGVTEEALAARVQRLKAKLAAKEADLGAQDRVVRQFLKQGEAMAKAATTDAERKAAWKFLDDVAAQLGGG